MMVAGIGFRKGVSASEVVAAVEAALGALGFATPALEHTCGYASKNPLRPGSASTPLPLHALATAAFKAGEPGITAAADALGLPLLTIAGHELRSASARCITRSAASLAATGIASVSEASALAAAGEGARLLGPRVTTGNVTCAIAQTKDQT